MAKITRPPFIDRRSISNRVLNSFSDNSKEEVSKYIDWLNVAMSNYARSIQRNGLLALLLIAIFELVINSKNEQISLESFRIYKGSVILQFIPALVSYLYLQLFIDTAKQDALGRALSAAFKRWSVKGSDNNIDDFIVPPAPLYWNATINPPHPENHDYGRERIEGRAVIAFVMVTLCGFLAFEAQSYTQLFKGQPSQDILWIISLCFTVMCLIIFITYLVAFGSEPD